MSTIIVGTNVILFNADSQFAVLIIKTAQTGLLFDNSLHELLFQGCQKSLIIENLLRNMEERLIILKRGRTKLLSL